MSPTEIGVVFAYLLRWREISGNPPGRSLRDGEREAARILANCNSSDLDDFEGFLNAQGFSLVDRDGVEFGIPPKAGSPNTIWVLTRKRGEYMAPYIDSRWYIDAMRDGRGGDRRIGQQVARRRRVEEAHGHDCPECAARRRERYRVGVGDGTVRRCAERDSLPGIAVAADLGAAHDRNDEVLERIYIGRRFKNDTERLEKLFDLYTKMTASAAPANGRKRKAGANA